MCLGGRGGGGGGLHDLNLIADGKWTNDSQIDEPTKSDNTVKFCLFQVYYPQDHCAAGHIRQEFAGMLYNTFETTPRAFLNLFG